MPTCILIVEDHEAMRRTVCRYLQSQDGFTVCGEAVDGIDAIEKAERLKPDLIVLDMHMPRMSGLEAAKRIHGMAPHVPIVMFTLHKDVLLAQRNHNGDLTTVVSKSDGLEALLKEIRRLTRENQSAKPV